MQNSEEGIFHKLVHAFDVYLTEPNDNSLRELASTAAAIAGFSPGEIALHEDERSPPRPRSSSLSKYFSFLRSRLPVRCLILFSRGYPLFV